jgi:hypothetical protein
VSVRDLEAQLAQGAERVGQGHFKVDSARALAKLRDFRLADPHHYVLELLRSAEASGATFVKVRNDADDFELTFDGPPFPADALADLFGCAFTPGASREAARLRLLALGVTGALALKPSWVDIRTGDRALRVSASGKVEPLPVDEPRDGTFIHVRERVGWRVLKEALTGNPPEARAIRQHARAFPAELSVNGERIDSAPQLAEVLVSTEVQEGALRLIAGLPAEAPASSRIDVVVHGVRVVTRAAVLPGAQVVAFLRHDTLRRNASGSDVVDTDPAFLGALARLRDLSDQLVEDLAKSVEEKGAVARRALTEIALQLAQRHGALPSARLKRTLDSAKILPGPSGEHCSVQDLRIQLQQGRPIRTAQRAYPREHYHAPVVLLDSTNAALEALLPEGPRRDVDEEVQLRLRREKNKRAFEASPVEPPRLPANLSACARVTLHDSEIRGEVALVSENAPVVRFLRGGRLLEQREVPELRPLHVRAVVDSPLVMPDPAWAKVAEDAGYLQLVEAVRRGASEALRTALAEKEPSDTARRHGRRQLVSLGWGPAGSEIPAWLCAASLYPLLGGGCASLDQIRGWSVRNWASFGFDQPLLDGSPTVVLDEKDRDALERLLGGHLTDVGPKLTQEKQVRQRLAAPAREPRLPRSLAKVRIRSGDVEGELGILEASDGARVGLATLRFGAGSDHGCEGTLAAGGLVRVEVDPSRALLHSPKAPWGVHGYLRFLPGEQTIDGPVVEAVERHSVWVGEPVALSTRVPVDAISLEVWFRHWIEGAGPTETVDRGASVGLVVEPGPQLTCELLRDGVALHRAVVPARYGVATGVVECHALAPAPDWQSALPGSVLDRCVAAVEAAQRPLCASALDSLKGRTLFQAPAPLRDWLVAFLVDELTDEAGWRSADELRTRAIDAPLFAGAHGLLSLRTIAEAADRSGEIAALAPEMSLEVPEGLCVVLASGAERSLLRAVVHRPCSDATAAIERARVERAFLAQPVRQPGLPDGVSLKVGFSSKGIQGVIGCRRGARASVELLRQGRRVGDFAIDEHESWSAATFGLPVRACLNLDDESVHPGPLSEELEVRIGRALRVGGRVLLEAALQSDQPEHRALLLLCVATRAKHGGALPAVFTHPLFPTLGGQLLSTRELDARPRIAYATRAFSAELADERVVLAEDELVRAALTSFGTKAVDVTSSLAAEEEVRRRHARAQAVEIHASPSALLRRAFTRGDVEGELALVPEETSDLRLFSGNRPVGTIALGPRCVDAAANCDALVPRADLSAIEGDASFDRVKSAVLAEVAALGDEVAQRLPRAPALGFAALRLAAWLATRDQLDHPLVSAELLSTTEGTAVSPRELFDAQRLTGSVAIAEIDGALLGDSPGFVWKPREGERELFGDKLRLVNVTKRLRRAAEIRSRPQLANLSLPGMRWREPLCLSEVEGEVAVAERPTGKIEIRLFREHRLVQTIMLNHPIGGAAVVEAAALHFSATSSKVVPDAAWDSLAASIGAAVDRSLARLLREDQNAAQPLLGAALDEWLHKPGPVADALLALPAFTDLAARPVTLGAVLSRAARGPIAVSRTPVAGVDDETASALLAGPAEMKLLERLIVPVLDRTAELRSQADLAARLAGNRLPDLGYHGRALVRLRIEEGGWRGELALPLPLAPADQPGLCLAKQQVAICRIALGSGAAGVLDHCELPVSAGWDEVHLGEPERAFLREKVRTLYQALAQGFEGFEQGDREAAAAYLLRHLSEGGMAAPAHVDRLSGPEELLARCKAFRTADGGWTDLRAIADRALRRGDVEVVAFDIEEREVAEQGAPVLRAASLDAAWIDELAAVLGADVVARIASRSVWQQHVSTEDPDDRTPLGAGLRRLRSSARLLHADAFGRLGGNELREVRVRRGDGRAPVAYDPKQALAFLDPAHPGVRRALEESGERPDRLYVLLASIYGAVNRAFEHVTDEDEARLAAALLDHLAANDLRGVP